MKKNNKKVGRDVDVGAGKFVKDRKRREWSDSSTVWVFIVYIKAWSKAKGTFLMFEVTL